MHISIITKKHTQSSLTSSYSLSLDLIITTSLLLGNYCSTEPSKNTMKPTSSFTSHKLLLLLLISSLSLIFFFLLSSFSTTSTTIASRLLIPKTGHGDDDIVVNTDVGFSQMNSVLEKGIKDDEKLLMGVEEVCGDGDEEECLKRRMISEAHLDYIYTQHQHP